MDVNKAFDIIKDNNQDGKIRNTPYHRLNLTVKEKNVFVLPLGDIHMGNKYASLEEVKKVINDYSKDRNCYFILMGDLVEMVLASTPISPFEQSLSPEEQEEIVIDLLEPIKDRILGSVIGTHERRLLRNTSFNITKRISRILGCPYLDFSGFLEVNINNKAKYIFYITHGAGGASAKSGKINRMHKMAVTNEADIYITAHNHDSMVDRQVKRIVTKDGIVNKMQYFVLAGHFLNYEGSYADEKQYPIGVKDAVLIILGADKKSINVVL